LIGGGPGAVAQTRKHIKQAVAALDKAKPLVAYVGVASDDNAGFRTMLSAAFVGTGARLEPVRLAAAKAKVSAARQVLDDSDLVFMSGGDVERGMALLYERGVVGDFHRLAASGKPFLGISAGSIMLCRHWVRFPDDDDAKAEPFDCLGIAPLHMDAHSEDDDWSELKTLVRLLGRAAPKEAIGYGVPSKGCLKVTVGNGTPSLAAMGAPVARIKFAAGAAVHDGALAPA
jgi:peptidase E